MQSYTVITENDESEWDDATGISYHFPKRYLKHLQPGTKVVYYKGSLKNRSFREKRLSDKPHYFGLARIGSIYPDATSEKGDYFAEILDYQPFDEPVLAKQSDGFLEQIPRARLRNYWRDGVREITVETYERIASQARTST